MRFRNWNTALPNHPELTGDDGGCVPDCSGTAENNLQIESVYTPKISFHLSGQMTILRKKLRLITCDGYIISHYNRIRAIDVMIFTDIGGKA